MAAALNCLKNRKGRAPSDKANQTSDSHRSHLSHRNRRSHRRAFSHVHSSQDVKYVGDAYFDKIHNLREA